MATSPTLNSPSADELRAAIASQSAKSGPGSPVISCPLKQAKTWIEIRLVDMEGNPVGSKKYRIKAPDGKISEGSLDSSGVARVSELVPGTCMISFTELDEEAWERI